MTCYYNDNDTYCCEWLGNLTEAGELTRGRIDNRSIKDVRPEDLEAFIQCHFFAGCGGWPLALRLAGWPEDVRVWSGSCPCQPLSCAGKRAGEKDERHLWPEFYRLISECRPDTIFGEQVASTDGWEWLDGISLDLEELGYAVGAVELCSPGVGAPHIRQRLFWLADAANNGYIASENGRGPGTKSEESRMRQSEGVCIPDRLGDTKGTEHMGARKLPGAVCETPSEGAPTERPGSPSWNNYRIVVCRDLDRHGNPKLRRIPDAESGILPLAHGIPRKLGPPLTGLGQVGIRAARANRDGRLRGYGNAICVPLAVEFIRAYLESKRS